MEIDRFRTVTFYVSPGLPTELPIIVIKLVGIQKARCDDRMTESRDVRGLWRNRWD